MTEIWQIQVSKNHLKASIWLFKLGYLIGKVNGIKERKCRQTRLSLVKWLKKL